MKPIIKVDKLGKRYRLATQQANYGSLRDTLAGMARAPLRALQRNGQVSAPTIWALRDASFEVAPGEAVGIIGRTEPASLRFSNCFQEHAADLGRIEPLADRESARGRAGFHPELTGGENIFSMAQFSECHDGKSRASLMKSCLSLKSRNLLIPR